MIFKIYNIVTVLIITLILCHCANPGHPTGGEKDELPPRMIKSTPEFKSLNFSRKKIVIEFDEIIVLDNIIEKFIMSPPLEETPTVEARLTKIIIDLKGQEMQPNTTYTLEFANAIKDNNEGNILPNFSFVFSTGISLDSLKAKGQVLNAFNLEPEIGVLVMLYNKIYDSIPYQKIPIRVAKTNNEGFFELNSIQEGTYKIFALKDGNRNYKFDLYDEPVAFLDSLITPVSERKTRDDTLHIDTIHDKEINIDTIINITYTQFLPDDLTMFLFVEDKSKQYLTNDKREEKAKIELAFNRPLKEKLKVKVLNIEKNIEEWTIEETTPENNEIIYWITDSNIWKQDTLLFEITYYIKDSLEKDLLKTDTLPMKFKFVEKPKTDDKKRTKKKKKQKKVEIPKTIFENNISSQFDLDQHITLTFETPIITINNEYINFFEQIDTLYEPRKYLLRQDSTSVRKYDIIYDFEPEKSYMITFDSLAFIDVYGLTNDSISQQFRTKEEEDYGSVFIAINDLKENAIIQLLKDDKEETVVKETHITQSEEVAFYYVDAGEYKIKMILDQNDNGKWDTGDYLKGIKPDKVMYFPQIIEVKVNFDYDLIWSLSEGRWLQKPVKKDKKE